MSAQPQQAARHEAREEAFISDHAYLIQLDSIASIPAIHFADHHFWRSDPYVIPEYSFGIKAKSEEVYLSGEHSEYA